MTEDSKVVYSTVGKAAGINVLFDPEYTSKRIQVDIANVSLLDALRIVGISSGTFWHAVTPNTIFVAMNTRAKRQELEEKQKWSWRGLADEWKQLEKLQRIQDPDHRRSTPGQLRSATAASKRHHHDHRHHHHRHHHHWDHDHWHQHDQPDA